MKDRPVLQIPLHPFERLLDVAALLFCGIAFLLSFSRYAGLPDQIPTHFNLVGNPDAYGNKSMVFILPAIATFSTLLLFLLARYPHTFNYPIKITPENAPSEYQKARFLIRVLNALTALMFMKLTFDILKIAAGESQQLSAVFWLITATLVASPLLLLMMWPKLKLPT